MATLRDQVLDLIRHNPNVDYRQKLVLRYTVALLAEVDKNLRGVGNEGRQEIAC